MIRYRLGLSRLLTFGKTRRRGLALVGLATVLAAWAVAESLTRPANRAAYSVKFSPDGARVAALAVTDGVGSLLIWDGQSGRLLSSTRVTGLPLGLAFSPDSRTIAVGTWPGIVTLHDAESGRSIRTFEGLATPVRGLEFTPDGRMLVAGASDGKIIGWDVENAQERIRFDRGPYLPVNALAISGDGRFIAAAGGLRPGSTTLHDLTTGQTVARASLANVREPLAFVPGTSTLAGVVGGGLQLTDLDRDETASTSSPFSARPLTLFADGRRILVRTLAFSADGRLIATGGDDEMLRAWDSASGRLVASMGHHRKPPGPLPDNIRGLLYDSTSGLVPLRTVNTIWSVSFSPDGKRVASGSQDGSVWVRTLPGTAAVGSPDLVLVPAPGRPGWWNVLLVATFLVALSLVAAALVPRRRPAMSVHPSIPANSG
jgi:WD40 repeat protein